MLDEDSCIEGKQQLSSRNFSDTPGSNVGVTSLRLKNIAALVSIALAASCSHSQPKAGAPETLDDAAWIRVSGPHLSVTTDMAPADARAEVTRLEQTLDAMEQIAWGFQHARIPRLRFILFRSQGSYRALQSTPETQGFRFTNLEAYDVMEPGRSRASVALGEREAKHLDPWQNRVARAATEAIKEPLPYWVSQGTISFLSLGEVKYGAFQIGELPKNVRKFERTRAAAMRAPRAAHTPMEDASAFAATYFLRVTQPTAYQEFNRRLAEHESEPEAFKAAFPDLSNADLTQAISVLGWVQPETPVASVKLAPLEAELHYEELSAADVHALWAALYLGFIPTRSPTRAADELSQAETLEPGNVSAGLLRLHASGGDRLQTLRAIAAAHPEDTRACRLLRTESRFPEDEKLACADRVISEEPDDPGGHSARASVLAARHKVAEADAQLTQIEGMGLPDPLLLVIIAGAHSDAGECKQALELMSRAFADVPLADLRRVKLEGAAVKVKNRCSPTP